MSQSFEDAVLRCNTTIEALSALVGRTGLRPLPDAETAAHTYVELSLDAVAGVGTAADPGNAGLVEEILGVRGDVEKWETNLGKTLRRGAPAA